MTDSNEEKEIKNKLKPTAGDVVHTIVKAGISAIPFIGGPAAEIFSSIITPPLSKRRDEWLTSVAGWLKRLEEKFDMFKIEDLSKNEIFITTVMYATQVAIRNHQKEKLDALRNAILNSALPNSAEEDLQLMFLNFVDTLTPWHLKVLKYFHSPQECGEKISVTQPTRVSGCQWSALDYTFEELKEKRDFYAQIVKDLDAKGLIDINSANVTSMGKQFIKFITSPV